MIILNLSVAMSRSASLTISVLSGLLLACIFIIWQRETIRSPIPVPVSYADAVASAQVSVVDIMITPLQDSSQDWSDQLLQEFSERVEFSRETRPRIASGIIIDDRGHILTNYHVVSEPGQISVRFASGQMESAERVSSDPGMDLAVIRARATNAPPIRVDKTPVRVGDVVLALGNAFGVGQGATMGIVSAIGRQNVGLAKIEDLIQTDAAVNPGNSGGALINPQGELIGVTSGIFSTTGSYQGLSFAIPANAALLISRDLIDKGTIRRTYLGISARPLSPEETAFFGPITRGGLLITQLVADSPSEKAGIQPGDILVGIEVSGAAVRNANLQQALRQLPPDQALAFSLLRAGKLIRLTLRTDSRRE